MSPLKALVILAFFSACCAKATLDQHGVPHAAIEGNEWRISQYYVDRVLLSPHPQLMRVPSPHISFVDGKIYGSPGCGQFTGTYSKSGDDLKIAAKWQEEAPRPCNDDEKEDAAKMLEALSEVRRIGDPPKYWGDDSIVLNNRKGEIQVTLAPKQVGNDLSEFVGTYWQFTSLSQSKADLSPVVIQIWDRDVSFSTPDCLLAVPFEYQMTGLKFFPAHHRGCATEPERSGTDWQIARVFESDLHSIHSYQQAGGTITFFGKAGQSLMVLAAIPPTAIENRAWRIERYRAPGVQPTDKEGLAEAKRLAILSLVNGRVEGGPGCGVWVGRYQLSGTEITIHASGSVAGLCYQGAFVQSEFVEKAFQGTLRIEQTTDHVLLRDVKGQAEIQLVPY